MDSISLIVTALESAIIAGSQAALTDTVKETLNGLKNRILLAVPSKKNAELILEEYEKDPKTWEKPLRDILAKASLPQDETTLSIAQTLIDLVKPQLTPKEQFTYHNHAPIQNAIQGNSYGPISFTTNTQSKDEIEEGKTFLKRGQDALLHGNYMSARRNLNAAIERIPEEQLPEEVAQILYLQALTYLDGKRPFSITLQMMRRVEELMQSAIHLNASHSYLYTFALFKCDFAQTKFEARRHTQEAQDLLRLANTTTQSPMDKENMCLLSYCQPSLVQEMMHL